MSKSDVSGPGEPEDHDRYEYQDSRAVRGLEARTIAKWEADGWELVSREQGPLMRTDMRFRRVWPRTPGAWVTKRAQAFGRLTPMEKLHAAKIPGAVLVGLVVVALVVGALAGGGDDSKPVAAPTKAAATKATTKPTPKATTATSPKPKPSKAPATKKATPKPEPTPEGPLTVDNNADLKKLLAADEFDEVVSAFAKKYAGEEIEFDANVADVALHGDYDTRYDFLIYGGDYSEVSASGPNFQFSDVNNFQLNSFKGDQVVLSEGDNIHIVAKVGEFNEDNGLFQLDPVSTKIR